MDKLIGRLSVSAPFGTLTIDETITGEPGTEASVENIGTTKDAVLRFTIPAGADGKDGKDGVDGKDGKDGVNGADGKDGVDGQDGKDGQDGAPGADGQNGQDGQDGERGFGILSVTTAPTDAGVKRTIKPSDEGVTASINDAIQYFTGDGDSYVYLVTDDDYAELKTAWTAFLEVGPDYHETIGGEEIYGWMTDEISLFPVSPDASGACQPGDVFVNEAYGAFVIVDEGTVEIDGVWYDFLQVREETTAGAYHIQYTSAPVDRYIPVATVKAEAGVDEVLVGDIIKHGDNLYKVNSVDSTNANLDEAENIKGANGTNGTNGTRGFGILSVTTAPTATSGTVSGKAYTYRMTGSTVRTQAGVTAVYAGDIVKHGTKLYPVVHATSSYVYMTDPTDIQGAQGPAYTLTAQDKADIADLVLADLPTWTGGAY